jgi:iron complex transport system permease protein
MDSPGRTPAINHQTRITQVFVLLILLLLVLVITDLMIGPVKIPPKELISILFGSSYHQQIWKTILFDFRIPKTLTAILAGASLSISGLQMQTVFRNPLAGPDVLGISAGASLGVALVIMGFGDFFIIHNLSYLGSWIQILSASVGAGLVLMLIMFVSWRVGDIMTILILGILFGSAASAIVSFLQYFSNQSVLKTFVIWSMGNLGNLTVVQLRILSICIVFGFLLVLINLKIMNALILGETYASSMGVNIRLSRSLVFISVSILSGSITAFCGPIAFVGIAVPHFARLVMNTANHYILVPASALLGSGLLLMADILSQIPQSGIILPINTVTSLVGIPMIIWVIVYNRKLMGIN